MQKIFSELECAVKKKLTQRNSFLTEIDEVTRKIFETINEHLSARGLLTREGTIADATLISTPPSTTKKITRPITELHQSKKTNQWHFRMKAHAGVDVASDLVHALIGTVGKVADVTQPHALCTVMK